MLPLVILVINFGGDSFYCYNNMKSKLNSGVVIFATKKKSSLTYLRYYHCQYSFKKIIFANFVRKTSQSDHILRKWAWHTLS